MIQTPNGSRESLVAKQIKAAAKLSQQEELKQNVAREVYQMIRSNGGTGGIGAQETIETLRELDIKCEQARVDAVEAEDDETPWVETTESLYKLILRKRTDVAGYQDYHGVKLCLTGQSERLKERLERQLDAINHPASGTQAGDAKVNQPTTVKAKAGSATLR